MRKFNQTISIEIEVDSIANQLLNTINPEFKHRIPVVEAIIGTALNNRDSQALGYIFNALSGHLPEINYKVGDLVNCTATTYMYVSEQSRAKKDSESAPLGKSKVIAINPFSSTPLQVEFDYHRSDGTIRKDTMWVKMNQCSNIVRTSDCSDESIDGIYKYEDIFS